MHSLSALKSRIQVKAKQKSREFILHIEVQNDNQHKMPLRMLRYYTDIALGWPAFEIEQYLIYIGKPALSMASGIENEHLSYQYTTIDMHRVDCSVFMHQTNPEAVVLAILCDFQQQDKRLVIRKILNKIQQLTLNNRDQYKSCMLMLEILSQNRDLSDLIKEEEKMLSAIKLEDLPSYELAMERGLERGIEEGLEKGLEEGLEKGLEKGEQQTQNKVVKNAHGAGISLEMICQITGLTEKEVQAILNA